MVTAHNVTTKKDFVSPLAAVTEGDSISTATDFGVTPTSSPDYTTLGAAGRVLELQIGRDIVDSPVNVLGSEDVFDAVKNEELYAFTVKSQIFNTTYLKYGVNPCGGGVGSIDESLTFKFSKLLDGVENFTQMSGARCASTSLTLDRGAWEMDQTWVCKDITIDSATDPDTTTPVNVTNLPSTDVWRHQDAGTTPFTWNSANFGERRFSLNINRDLAMTKVNGSEQVLYTKPSNRSVEFSVDVIRKNVTLLTDYENKTKRTASYEINDGTAQINFTDCVIQSWDERHTATDTDILIEPITVRAKTATVLDT